MHRLCLHMWMNRPEHCKFGTNRLSDRPLMSVYFSMELALQVVGLKMTGKMEDAKSIAIRIVGSSAQEDSALVGSSNVANMSRNSSYATTEFRRMLLSQDGPDEDFEKLILDFLRIIDVKTDDGESATVISTSLSHPMSNGQTLLHLSTFLNFPRLAQFLVDHGIDLEVQDQNGFTALHFAAMIRSNSCAKILCNAGAKTHVTDLLGRTAASLSPELFDSLETILFADSDDESQWADVDDSTDEHTGTRPTKQIILRRSWAATGQSRRRRRRVVSNAGDCIIGNDEAMDKDDAATVVGVESPDSTTSPIVDEKTAATFAALLQRAWSQIQTPQFIPQMPQIPQLPHFRDVPAWVFPVFVPMPAWPTFLGEKGGKLSSQESVKADVADSNVRVATPEGRVSWEKWVAQMSAVMATMQRTNSDTDHGDKRQKGSPSDAADIGGASPSEEESRIEVAPTPAPTRSILRRFGSSNVQITDQEVNAYTYRPKQTNKLLKKGD